MMHPFSFRKLTSMDMPRSTQALADITEIRFGLKAEPYEVILTATPFGDSVPTRSVTLKPRDEQDEKVVEIHLVNLPSLEFHPSRGEICEHTDTDMHFELYYGLLRQMVEIDDRRAARRLSRSRVPVQPDCGLDLCETFGTDLRSTRVVNQGGQQVCSLNPRFPPACPPVLISP
jgi:hypothetical protein